MNRCHSLFALPHPGQVVSTLAGTQAFAGIGESPQQSQGEEGRVALVHVIPHELEAQGLEQAMPPTPSTTSCFIR